MHTFAVGQWPAKSGGLLDAVEANDVHEVPAALTKRYDRKRKIVPNRADRYPGVLIDNVQYRIFDLKNQNDMEELCLVLARIGGGQGPLN